MFMELNPSQLRAVSFGSGPCLVLAGPGSGKTTVIIRRLHNLISEYHIRPENILAVTFSRAAALEMSGRFAGTQAARMNAGSPGVTFGTVHSIFLKILKEDLRPDISVISDGEATAFINHELKKYSVPCQNADRMCRDVLLAISRFKAGAVSGTAKARKSGPQNQNLHIPDPIFMKIFSDYSFFLKERSLFDFDDLISETARLFRRRSDILTKWQERFRYINIDEFQDLSPLQYRTLMLLAGKKANVFAVGDDDQSIYGFRGAGRNVMQRFISDHPGAVQIVLGVNYRCSPAVLEKSAKVIRENSDRFEKTQVPVKEGGIFTLTAFNGRDEEYTDIIGKLKELVSKGRESAVLFRSSYDHSLFVMMLKKEGIRFECRDGAGSFSDLFPVRDVISYLNAAQRVGSRSSAPCREDLLRIINRPERYIKRESLIGAGSAAAGSAECCFDAMRSFYRKDPVMVNSVDRLKRDLLMLSSLSPFAAVRYVRSVLGYDRWLLKNAASKGLDADECMESLELLESLASECTSLGELMEAALWPFGYGKSEKISVMTMHSSKGLEFDAVFLPDVNEGIIPCKSAIEEETIDEERRLLYVAMTRAKEELHISYVNEYRYKPAEASRLIRNLV